MGKNGVEGRCLALRVQVPAEVSVGHADCEESSLKSGKYGIHGL